MLYQIGLVMFDHIVNAFKKYKKVGGRSSRAEFWWFFSFVLIISFELPAVVEIANSIPSKKISLLIFALLFLLGLFMVLPMITLTIRRLHDMGFSGWHLLWIYLLPNAIILAGALLGISMEIIQYLNYAVSFIIYSKFNYLIDNYINHSYIH